MGKTTYNRGKRAHAVRPNVEEEAMVRFESLSLFLLLALLSGCAAPAPSATPTTSSTPVPTITPTPTENATSAPKPAWQQTIESQDSQDKYFQIVDGKPVINLYDTQATESIILNQESVKKTVTTDGLNPNILTAQDADSNQYAFNPDHGWFKIPEVNMDYAHLQKYTEVEENYFYDGRNNIVRALNYANSPDKIPGVHPVFWVTALGNTHNQVYLSFLPVERVAEAQRDWPEEYQKTFGQRDGFNYVFSGFLKVNLKAGGYIYVMDRTIAIDETHTTGFANGFDPATLEKMANTILGDGTTELNMLLNNGHYDLVTILPPPEQLSDGTPISFDPNATGLKTDSNPVVAGMQGPRGESVEKQVLN